MSADDRDALFEEAAGAAVGWDTDRALNALDELLAQYPDDIDGLLLRGHVLEMRGQIQSARPLYERVLALDPGNVHALIDLADCDQSEGRYEKALDHLEEAQARVQAGFYRTDRSDEIEEVLERKYACLLKLGRRADARETLKLAQQLLPGSKLWQPLQRDVDNETTG